MATIETENRKTLRQAMRVSCGFSESTETPTSITPFGNLSEYEGVANMDAGLYTRVIMDLAGDGFINNGEAVPMETDTDSFRYGYISEDAALPDGSFLNSFGVTVTATQEWQYITVETITQDGAVNVEYFEPTWIAGSATVFVANGTPGQRSAITAIYLGRTWLWNNSNLLSVNLDLRSVSTALGGELEASSIEIRAYEPTDYTNIIGRIVEGTPIWYSAGYEGDSSQIRNFYLSEPITWENNVLTLKGQDATSFLDDSELATKIYNFGANWRVGARIKERIDEALAPIDYVTVGQTIPVVYGAAQYVEFVGAANRSVISQFTGLFRDPDYLRITYVDAGRPTLITGDFSERWTIYADEIGDLVTNAEQSIHSVEMVIPQYYSQYNSEIATIEATAGMTYYVELDPPCSSSGVYISPDPTSSEQIGNTMFKFIAAADTTYTISGWEVFENLTDSNNPYKADGNEPGITYKYDYTVPIFYMIDNESLTKYALQDVLNRSNIVYEFTYRGNPHIQPRDVLDVELAKWVSETEILGGLYPETDLYPSVNLFPMATYKNVRKIVKEWVTMTVDSITLEHTEGGGLSSKIRARKGEI